MRKCQYNSFKANRLFVSRMTGAKCVRRDLFRRELYFSFFFPQIKGHCNNEDFLDLGSSQPSPWNFFSWKQNRREKKKISAVLLYAPTNELKMPVKYLNVLITKRLSSSTCLELLPILFSTHFASHLIPQLLTSLFTVRGYPLVSPKNDLWFGQSHPSWR